MAVIAEILATKGPNVVQISPDATVFEAAERMNDHHIGGLVVADESGVCGIITERDFLRLVVCQRRDPATTPVRAVMTADVVCCHPHTTIEEARVAMKDRRIRHLPVMDEGKLCGIISIGDLNAFDVHSKEMTIYLLNEYIYGHASTAAAPRPDAAGDRRWPLSSPAWTGFFNPSEGHRTDWNPSYKHPDGLENPSYGFYPDASLFSRFTLPVDLVRNYLDWRYRWWNNQRD